MTGDQVSVLLAVHNGERWLEQAIESVQRQSHPNWELIVVDNGSQDGSYEIAQRFAEREPRVLAHRLREKGKNLAYNHAFSRSTGSFVAYFAADDILPVESLERRLAPLVSAPGPGYSTCALRTFSDMPKYDGLVMPRNLAQPNFSGGALMFSRELAERVFPLPETLPNEDTWTQLHLRSFGMHFHVPEVLYHYRIHGLNSFGYDVPFQVKRDGFLRRARAHEIFLERYQSMAGENEFIQKDVVKFVGAVSALRDGGILSTLVSPHMPVSMKLLILYYSSPLLYRMRNLMFRFLSGRIVQT